MTSDASAPPAVALWTMRLLALGALSVALFLAGIEAAWLVKQQTSDVPFCSAFTWLDCNAVLTHPRWSKWLGMPVAFPAAALYLLATVAIWSMNDRRSAARRRLLWGILTFAAVVILIATGWFVYLQVARIERICLWCMVDHALGSTLALLVLLLGPARGKPVFSGAMAGAALMLGQLLVTPTYVERTPSIGRVNEQGNYVEAGEQDRIVTLRGGSIQLNRDWHPMLGNPDAQHVLVEVVDFTCPRCRGLHETLSKAREQLGSEYAVLVLPFPLDKACNRHVYETGDRHRDACFLAKLAQAVFLVDASQYPAFHHWLFEHQSDMSRDKALNMAKSMIDPSYLAGKLTDARLDELIRRDVELAIRLGTQQLPGLFIGDGKFSDIPDDPATLAAQIRQAAASR